MVSTALTVAGLRAGGGCSYGGGVRLTDFRDSVEAEFGVVRGDALVRDHVLPALGTTGAAAIEAGVEPREVWRALCEEFEVPAARR